MVYAEITRGGREPVFVPLLQNGRVGESHKVAVLEMSGRPNWWRVWLDGKTVTEPVLLENSTKRWRPIATAESWNGGRAVCNTFAFRFDGVGVAAATGGSWQAFAPGSKFRIAASGSGVSAPPQVVSARCQPARRALRVRSIQRVNRARRRGAGETLEMAEARSPAQLARTRIGVPSGMRSRRKAAVLFETRIHPCETAWPMNWGAFEPWSPTTPPPGQSESFE